MLVGLNNEPVAEVLSINCVRDITKFVVAKLANIE